jgi:hypothetical protein
MAYNIHYRSTAVSMNGNTYQLDIYEKDFTGSIITIPTSSNPFVIKVNASSDNQFEPILASELNVNLDITDYQDVFINFANEDQFKYFGRLTYSGNVVFQGWVLADAMTSPFTTGVVECAFSIIDGLAMLKSIYYTPTQSDSTILETVRQIITNCLNTLNYPLGFNLNIATSTFATAMDNRTDDISNDPMSQSYMWPSNWFNDEQITTPSVDPFYYSDYINCYDILNALMLGWGCQIFQANGEWYVANVNEMASDNIYLSKYDNEGDFVSAANQSINYTIKAYNDEDYLYFIDNTQAKVLRQGFSQIYFKTPSEFPINVIDNGFLRRVVSGNAESWLKTTLGSGTATFNTGDIANYYELAYGGGGPSSASLKSLSTQEVFQGDVMEISFNYEINSTEIPDIPTCIVKLEIVDGGTTYYYASDETWKIVTGGISPQYYEVKGNNAEGEQNSTSIKTQPVPVDAQYYFTVVVQNEFVNGQKTQLRVQFSQFTITYSNAYSYNLISFQKSEAFQNRKTVDGFVGVNIYDNYNIYGGIVNSFGQYTYTSWYRQADTFLAESQTSLLALVAQDYYFTQSKAQLNVDCSLMSLMSKKTGASTKTHLSLFTSFKIEDTTTGPNSLTGKYYFLGNCEFDLINDTMNGITLLEVSNTVLPSTSKNIIFTVN